MENQELQLYNKEAEQAVLGAIMADSSGRAIAEAVSRLKPESFYIKAHQIIFEAASCLYRENTPCDIILVSNRLLDKGQLETVGGRAYINDLALSCITATNISQVANKIQEKFAFRQLLKITNSTSQRIKDSEADLDEVVKGMQSELTEISCLCHRKADTIRFGDFIMDTLKNIENNYARQGKITGVPSGFDALDGITGGFQPSDLIILAARPGMGKTALVMNIARNAVKQENTKPVLIFSLEMSKEQLAMRLMASESDINALRLKLGTLNNDSDWAKIYEGIEKIDALPLYVNDQSGITVEEIAARAKDLYTKHNGLSLIVVDYLQLVAHSGKEQREREISKISAGLKGLAKELQVPVIALSQLSRAVEARQDKRPMLSDLRDSGSIEQDADIVLFVYRDEYYTPTEENKNKAEIIIAKHRNGELSTVELYWNKRITSFTNTSNLNPQQPAAGAATV